MATPGSSQGRAYTGAMGRGEAFILPEAKTTSLLINMHRQEQAKRDADAKYKRAMAMEAAKEKKKQAAEDKKEGLKTLADLNQESWYRHSEELVPMVKEIKEEALNLMQSGVDNPFADVRGLDLMKKVEEYKNLANFSMQLSDEYKAWDQKATSGEYTDESVIRGQMFWQKGLQEMYEETKGRDADGNVVSKSFVYPRLVKKDAEFKFLKELNSLATIIGNDQSVVTDDQLVGAVRLAFTGQDQPKWVESTSDVVSAWSDETKEIKSKQAEALGMNLNEFVVYDGLRHKYKTGDFDWDSWKSSLKATELYNIEEKITGEGLSRTTQVIDEDRLNSFVEAELQTPHLFEAGVKDGVWKTKDEARTWMRDFIKGKATYKDMTKVNGAWNSYFGRSGGYKKKEVNTNFVELVGALSGTDRQMQNNALSYLAKVYDVQMVEFISPTDGTAIANAQNKSAIPIDDHKVLKGMIYMKTPDRYSLDILYQGQAGRKTPGTELYLPVYEGNDVYDNGHLYPYYMESLKDNKAGGLFLDFTKEKDVIPDGGTLWLPGGISSGTATTGGNSGAGGFRHIPGK
jgi:hypothetical protein